MEAEAEKLVGQNPRDALILRRQSNLDTQRDARRRHQMAKRRERYDYFLRSFAPEYLAVKDANVFDSLSGREKIALGKICASNCWFKLIRHTSIFTALFGSLATLSIIHVPA